MSTARPYNFSAGPAILPQEVFEETADAVRRLGLAGIEGPEAEFSILEVSHRGQAFDAIHQEALALAREVLGIGDDYHVLLLQGGASLQFAMVPMNLHQTGKSACYVNTGSWSTKAIKEAAALGETHVLASSKETGFNHIPQLPEPKDNASYLHVTSNNTIYGTEFAELPDSGDVPLVVDMSSNIGSRKMDLARVALGYAGAQKNLGPSGVTLVFVREDLLTRDPVAHVPTLLRYTTHAEKNSLFNTPNTFGVLVLRNVLRWMKCAGGVDALGEVNARKARKLYEALDAHELYRPHAQLGSRSTMNVTWTLSGADDAERKLRTQAFLRGALEAGLHGLKGHRSVGGCRASIYNAFPEAGVDALVEFLHAFSRSST